MTGRDEKRMVPIREKLLTEPLTPLEDVRLLGSECSECGEVNLGEVSSCQNCAGEDLAVIALSERGKLWTFTVIRNRPPGDFKGDVPLGEGLVELPEGIRVKSPLVTADNLKIGMDVNFTAYPLYRNMSGEEVIAFRFDPV